ncbi:MAG: nucleotidyltransferase family protein [Candidatus Omnitrophota bacterium]
MSWTEEKRLLAGCSVINRDRPICHIVRQTIGSNLNWDYILENALENGTSSLLYRNLKEINDDGLVPRLVIKKLKDIYFDITAENIFLLEELGKVLKKFNEERISVIILKGAALLENIYQDIGLRRMRDIDILVKKKQLHKIDRTLKQLGYFSAYNWADYMEISPSQYLNSICYIKRQGKMFVILHLHWHIINTTVPVYSYGPINIERFWKEAGQTTIAGVKTLVMAPHHLLIHLSEHILKHSYSHFILFCDIFEVIRYCNKNGLNWELLVQDTVEFNLNKPVYYGLYFTSKFLGAEIPERVLTRLKPSYLNYGERKIQTLIEENRGLPDLNCFSYFVMNEKVTEKFKFVLRSIFPSREILALQYIVAPKDIRFHHYILKVKSAFMQGLRVLIYLLRRPT